MWNLLRKKSLLSNEDQFFQIESYKWLLKHFGGINFYKNTQLILPIENFFPKQVDSQEDAAKVSFEQVKKYVGLENWSCILEAQQEDVDPIVSPAVAIQNVEQNPLGTFSINENQEVVITYNPNITADPVQMIATFAHELSHYLTGTAVEPPPGGWDNWEFVTDICATFLGFGIFQANSTFNFQQYSGIDSQGWKTSYSGYLSEAEHSYSLAIFLLLKNIPIRLAYKHCEPNIKTYLKKAMKELDNSPLIEELRMVEYEPESDSTR